MRIQDTLHTAWRALNANRRRASLTMLGVIIGVGSVTLMTGIGKSMEGVILGQISILGPESMVIFPGSGGPESGPASARSGFDSLDSGDAEALESLKTIQSIAPAMFVPGIISHGREQTEPQVIGTNPNYYNNLEFNLDRGRLLDWRDEESARAVTVLGPDTADDLFPASDPLGQKVNIAGRNFTVVGILKPVGTAFFTNLDERAYLPLTTAQSVTGKKYFDIISMRHTGNPVLATLDVETFMRKRHGITNPDNDNFLVRNSSQAQDIFGAVSVGLTLFITALATISLVVGGIGIMNIMLVAVTERTKEIGLRKAVGAKYHDVLLQFLVEAIWLTLIGGLIGIVGGLLLSFVLSMVIHRFLADYLFAISIPAIFLALGMAAVTGLVFGIFPARKAAQLSPMEALRYE